LVRDIHARFDAKPPLPEKMAPQGMMVGQVPNGAPQLGIAV
tara:strand:+ start:410 stop:532 length:123 start_codon:yes stop_codon:yes gene_type:complete